MNPATSHHRKHHRINGWLPQISDCFRCKEDKLNCKSKIVYKSRRLADKKAERINVQVDWMLGLCKRPYRCRWCSLWHLTTESTELDTVRIEKMRRKWLRRTGLKDYGWNCEFEELSDAG